MKLTKIKGVYHASFRTLEGKTKTITTKCTDREEALKVVKASGLQDLELAAKAGRLTQQAIGYITTGRKLTMDEAVTKFLDAISRRSAPKTVHNLSITLTAWVRDIKLGKLPPSSIAEAHVDKWINDPESDSSLQTRRINLSSIRSFFDFCSDKGWSIGNPAGKQAVTVNTDILDHNQKEHAVRQPFTDEEIKSILNYCREHNLLFWRLAVSFSRELGLRLGDICNLEWECFMKPGLLVVHTRKTDKRLELPITERLVQLATEIPVADPKFIFPEQRRILLEVKQRAALSMQFGRILRKLGIKGKSFHSLRHTAATTKFKKLDKETLAKKLAETLSLDQIASLLGHSNTKTTKGYVH